MLACLTVDSQENAGAEAKGAIAQTRLRDGDTAALSRGVREGALRGFVRGSAGKLADLTCTSVYLAQRSPHSEREAT